jgi:hypothetical protein
MQWPYPSHPPAYVFAEETVGEEQRVILGSVYRTAYDANPNAVAGAARLRAFAKPLLVSLVLSILEKKLGALINVAPGLPPADQQTLATGLRTLRNRVAQAADGDRTTFIRSFSRETARVLRMLRGAAPLPHLYEALSTQIVSQISGDPNNATSGLPGLASGLALLGMGHHAGEWEVSRADPASASNGALTVTPTGGAPQRFFFVANQEAALKLQIDGTVRDDEPDAVIVYSNIAETRAARSPRRAWRSGKHSTRKVGVQDLMQSTGNLTDFRRRFREEAVL